MCPRCPDSPADVLVRMYNQIQELEARIEELEKRLCLATT